MEQFDAIVIGCGAMGSATLLELARRGLRAVGLDRFPPGHHRGSSHGSTRIIRRAYFEHPHYVPLVERAYEAWRALEARCHQTLLVPCGLLQVGPSDGEVLAGVRQSAKQHGLQTEEFDATEIVRRFPDVRVEPDVAGIYEAGAGYLHVEAAVVAMAGEAMIAGAELRAGITVHGWQPSAQGVTVDTNRGKLSAAKLVVTAGAWSGELLADSGLPLRVVRKPLYWFGVEGNAYDAAADFPAFLFETPDGTFYGLPKMDPHGIKVGQHSGGVPVSDPLNVSRDVDSQDLQAVQNFLAAHLPRAKPEMRDHTTCMYTMTADGHFIVDLHPNYRHVAVAAGFSGHGFKFAPVIGQALADLVCQAQTELPVDFLRLNRRSLRADA